jgi:hypothetical protein
MNRLLTVICAASALTLACSAAVAEIEQRGSASWSNRNRFRVKHTSTAAAGVPVAVDLDLPLELNPDSIRVYADNATEPIAAKTDWRKPTARVSFVASESKSYTIYFDEGGKGETERLVAPAMVGTGDRITFGRAGVRARLAVGLQPRPAALDADGDGDLDLVITCPDRPYNGIYLFRNIGSQAKPLFDRAEWLGPSVKELTAADFNGDGAIDLVTSGGYFSDFARNRLAQFVKVQVERSYFISRDDMWQPFDWDGDGKIDLLTGVSDWRDYGWDDAFDEQGNWTNGPLHGFVYWHRNTGSNAQPVYSPPVKLEADGKAIDLYGSPSPTPVDWYGRGVFDLIGGSFLDTVTAFRNTGTRTEPRLAAGELVKAGGKRLRMELCMIQPRVVNWHDDGRPSLLIAEEDGAVALVENTSPKGQEPHLAAPRYLEQVDPFVKSGALSRPVAVDWNADGKLDLIAGNSAGFIQYIENTGTKQTPEFTDRGNLKAEGKTIRIMAGPNGSIQGPAEAKWGYTNPSVGDWDMDGKLDILVNDIWGAVVWYRNIGSATEPKLAAAQLIEVEWRGKTPKPEWVWWEPKGKQLVTQWRTTPKVIDWDRDGMPDLVMLNHQGYLCLLRRTKLKGQLRLLPPERLFVLTGGRFLNLSAGRTGASGRRKVDFADMDQDGDMDLITDSNEGPIWYQNVGTQQKPSMLPMGTVVKAKLAGHNPTPNVVDWNGDGKLDLIVGAEDGFFYYFDGRYIANLQEKAN